MRSLLLVDDEDIVRVMLKTLVNWEDYGITEIFEASNGKEALLILSQNNINMVITDIRMPLMDGLELIQNITVKYPKMVSVIMTAYDDFDYARKALRMGVSDFIMKDEISSESINNLMSKVQGVWTKEKEKLDEESQVENLSHDFLLKEFLCGNVKQDQFLNKIFPGQSSEKTSRKVVLDLQIDQFEEMELKLGNEIYGFEKTFIECIKSFVRNYVNIGVFYLSSNKYLVILTFEYRKLETDINKEVMELVTKLKETITNTFDLSVTLSLSDLGTDIKKLHQQAEELLKYYILMGKNSVISTNNRIVKSMDATDINVDYQNYYDLLEARDYQKILGFIDELAIKIKNSGTKDMKSLYGIYMNLLLITNNFVTNRGLSFENILKVNVNFFANITKCSTVDELKAWFVEIIEKLSEYMDNRVSLHPKIRRMLDEIEKNFGEPLSLEQMAESLESSANYLSRLFLKETGVGYIDYLVQFRIRKAQELLKNTGHSVAEISNIVGYVNDQHFNKIFKKIVGKSPGEYRKGLGAI